MKSSKQPKSPKNKSLIRLVREFPDRSLKDFFEEPDNIRQLMEFLLPDVSAQLNYEGIAQTLKAEGELVGVIKTKREMVSKFLQRQFPQHAQLASQRLQSVSDPKVLDQWFDSLMGQPSWELFTKSVGWVGPN